MIKILSDTIIVNGKYSQKRILTYVSFLTATIYAFLPLVAKEFVVNEFVFVGFLGIGGFTIFRTQKVNQNETQPIEKEVIG